MVNLQYYGRVGKLYAIWFPNLILNILTLFLYKPWSKVKTRKYIFSNVEIFGDRLECCATGRDFLKGFLVVYHIFLVVCILLFAIISGVYTHFFTEDNIVIHTNDLSFFAQVSAIVFIIGFCVSYYVQYSSIRNHITKLKWRSMFGKLCVSAKDYTKLRIGRMIVNFLTLGLAVGKSDLIARRNIVNNSAIGKTKFIFTGDISGLNSVNFMTGILAIPTLFISRLWYLAALKNYSWRSTSIGNIKFDATYSGSKILGLIVSNLIIFIATAGLGTPIIIHRIAKFHIDNIQINGLKHDLEVLLQSS